MDHVNQYIFISGTGRSGTNITKDILACHPDVYSLPFEYRFTVDPDGIISTYNILKNTWSPFQADVAIYRLETLLQQMSHKNQFKSILSKIILWLGHNGARLTPFPYSDWELSKWFPNYELYVGQLLDELKEIRYGGYWPGAKPLKFSNKINIKSYSRGGKGIEVVFNRFLKGLYDDILDKNHASCFVEDNTWSLLYADIIWEILPEAKFIHVVRDPRDVVASMMQQRWCPSELPACIDFYKSIMNRIQTNNVSGKHNCFMVKLEDFVSDFDNQTQSLMEYLNLDIKKYKCNVELKKSSFGRWNREFSDDQKTMINKELHDKLNEYGYE